MIKLSLSLVAALYSTNAAQVYQVIYPSFNESFGDAVIFKDEPDQAAGGSDLIVGCNNNMQCARSLLHFDVNHLPDDAIVTDVQMTLLPAASVAEEDPSMTMNLHQVTRPWSRTTDSIPDGERDTWVESLAGTAAADGDVTWKYAIYPDSEWATAGGDVDDEVILTSVESKGWSDRASPLFFPMTDAFRRLVQGWIDGTVENNGVLVKRDADEDPNVVGMRILFHEQSGNKDYRSPKLLITYTSESRPEQMPSPPSGPGILLPGEPTRAPTTSAPTPEPACPITATGVEIFTGTSSQHASIFKDKGGLSQDKGAFGVGIVHSGEILRGLIKFPVVSIPKGSTITCAEIILQTTGPCGPCKGLVDVEMHRITSGWTTTGTNDFLAQQQPLLYQVELQGAGANSGDVTWTHSTYDAANPDGGGTRWGTAGGDVDPLVISMEVDDERGQHKFPSSEGFVDAIQSFVDGTADNHGFLFKTEESDEYVALKAEENSYKDYDTAYRLFKGEDEEEEAERPLLVVHYTLPKVVAAAPTSDNVPKSDPASTPPVTDNSAPSQSASDAPADTAAADTDPAPATSSALFGMQVYCSIVMVMSMLAISWSY
eukprot:CAMPEP_0196138492 /NCGR_PEP_ID=MMETSP0910-20130528/6111_1 /TAXON_ID=49265 /ORGANISM="Thalassiosira rotula, Strain GSO102" /LENGTH=599 /DNA_ID=CAMNT_0041399103 /DNA_START=3 /DNA_END=1802 /DNA_ORIENTATION=-